MKIKLMVLIIATGTLWNTQVHAHHSFAATYQIQQKMTIKGKLVQFLFRNPHSFVKVEAPDEKGQVQTWSIEWAGVTQLSGEHVGRDTLQPGDIVVVTGNPGRDPDERRLRMLSIARPSDGFKWEGVVQ
jgi:hypothetical protein